MWVRNNKGNVFVGNLPPDLTDERLAETFDPFGIVLSAIVARDPATGARLRYGFVDIATERAATKAIEALDGSELDGCKLNVKPRDKAAKETRRRRRSVPQAAAARCATRMACRRGLSDEFLRRMPSAPAEPARRARRSRNWPRAAGRPRICPRSSRRRAAISRSCAGRSAARPDRRRFRSSAVRCRGGSDALPVGALPVFVAAIADRQHQVAPLRKDRGERRLVLGVERDIENAGIVGDVLGDPEPGADDDPATAGRSRI